MKMHSYSFALITVIVAFGDGSRVLAEAKRYGISGGTMLLGKGTAKSRVLAFLELADARKEIVLMAADCCVAKNVITQLDGVFRFEKKGHGIAFMTPVVSIFGASRCTCNTTTESGGSMYQAIYTIVERGRAQAVIEAAERSGSRGGTIIQARGSGIHETSKLFSMEIEPEKEIVLIIAQTDKTHGIVAAIREELDIDEAGKGIVFVQDVNEAYGLN